MLKDLETDQVANLHAQLARVRTVFTDSNITPGTSDEAMEDCVELLADGQFRDRFETELNLFLSTVDTVLPMPEADPFLPAANLFAEIAKRVRRRYRDTGDFDPSLYGEKVRELIDKHMTSLGVDTILPPISITDPDYQAKTAKLSSRARASEIRLTVERDATVTAVIPPATDDAELAKAITAKRTWLYAKLRERAETGTPRPPREFVSGEGFPYLGRSYRLLLIDEATHPAVRLHRGRLELRRDRADDAVRYLVHWYRHVGEPWLRKRIRPWAQRMEVEVADLRVLPLGYRWGSCTAVGKLNIHWATMQLTPDLIDYVLVHELAHVRHPDHGPDFWRAVERPLPNFAARRTRLRLTGPDLWLPNRM